MSDSASSFGETFLNYAKNAGQTVGDALVAAEPLAGVPLGLLGFETSSAKERREDREFKKEQRIFARQQMADYYVDRERKDESYKYEKSLRPLQSLILKNNAEISTNNAKASNLRLGDLYQGAIDKSSQRQYSAIENYALNDLSDKIANFKGLTLQQQKELRDLPATKQFQSLLGVLHYWNSPDEGMRGAARKMAKELHLNISEDGKTLTLLNGKTVPFDENTKNMFIEDGQKDLSENASFLYLRDKRNEYVDGYVENKFIRKITDALNHPTNDNRGNPHKAGEYYNEQLKRFNSIDKNDFLFNASGVEVLSNGVIDDGVERQNFVPQMQAWAKLTGIKYEITQDGKVFIFKDNQKIDGKEYFEQQLAKNPVYRHLNNFVEDLKNINKQKEELSNREIFKQDSYADSDVFHNLPNRNIPEQKKEAIRSADYFANVWFNDMYKRLNENSTPEDRYNLLVQARDYRNILLKQSDIDPGDFGSMFDEPIARYNYERAKSSYEKAEQEHKNNKQTSREIFYSKPVGLVNFVPNSQSRSFEKLSSQKRGLDELQGKHQKTLRKHNELKAHRRLREKARKK